METRGGYGTSTAQAEVFVCPTTRASFKHGTTFADKESASLQQTVIIGPGPKNGIGGQRSATLTYNSRSRVPDQEDCRNRGINTNGQDRWENWDGVIRGTVRDNKRCNDSVEAVSYTHLTLPTIA